MHGDNVTFIRPSGKDDIEQCAIFHTHWQYYCVYFTGSPQLNSKTPPPKSTSYCRPSIPQIYMRQPRMLPLHRLYYEKKEKRDIKELTLTDEVWFCTSLSEFNNRGQSTVLWKQSAPSGNARMLIYNTAQVFLGDMDNLYPSASRKPLPALDCIFYQVSIRTDNRNQFRPRPGDNKHGLCIQWHFLSAYRRTHLSKCQLLRGKRSHCQPVSQEW